MRSTSSGKNGADLLRLDVLLVARAAHRFCDPGRCANAQIRSHQNVFQFVKR